MTEKTPEHDFAKLSLEMAERHLEERFQLSLDASHYIFEELDSKTRDVGLFALAMYGARGTVPEAQERLTRVTDKLDKVLPGQIFVACFADDPDRIAGAFVAPDPLPEDGIWSFKLYPKQNFNGTLGFIGQLELDESVFRDPHAPEVLFTTWFNRPNSLGDDRDLPGYTEIKTIESDIIGDGLSAENALKVFDALSAAGAITPTNQL